MFLVRGTFVVCGALALLLMVCSPSPAQSFKPGGVAAVRMGLDIQSEGKNRMSFQERRHSKRFDLGVRLTVQWTDHSGQREAHAVTKDVSSAGVYFYLPEAIPKGTPVEIEMTLPTQITLGAPVRVRCNGRIQRCVLKPGQSAGMATLIEKYEFLADTKDVA
jgi:hypothetical protein